MNWSDFPLHPSNRILRQFAGGWLACFSLLGAYHFFLRGHHRTGLALGLAGLTVGCAGLIRPWAVKWIFVGSTLLAFPVGWIVSQLALAAMFFGILSPIALWFGFRGRDLLFRKRLGSTDTYWLPKATRPDVKSYFRQY